MRLVFRAEATADLRRIASETRRAWGEAQAKAYASGLRDAIKPCATILCAIPSSNRAPASGA